MTLDDDCLSDTIERKMRFSPEVAETNLLNVVTGDKRDDTLKPKLLRPNSELSDSIFWNCTSVVLNLWGSNKRSRRQLGNQWVIAVAAIGIACEITATKELVVVG